MAKDLRFYPGAIDSLERTSEAEDVLGDAAKVIRDRARVSAGAVSSARARHGIAAESGRDEQGAYADVGYDKTDYGFVLWWHEVGTRYYSPTPHLRSAVRPIETL